MWMYAARHGLGKHISLLSRNELDLYFKVWILFWTTHRVFLTLHQYTYSSQVLGVLAMTLSKGSFTLLLRRLRIDTAPHFLSIPVVSIIIWTLFSIPSTIFQCGFLHPWNSSPANCPHRQGIWDSVAVLNIISDSLLAFHATSKIWNLKMDGRLRRTIMCLFLNRLL